MELKGFRHQKQNSKFKNEEMKSFYLSTSLRVFPLVQISLLALMLTKFDE
jgi:hypothetical protein